MSGAVVLLYRGLSDATLLEVLAAPGAGWTLIITQPDGTACVSASGEAWWQSCGKETPA